MTYTEEEPFNNTVKGVVGAKYVKESEDDTVTRGSWTVSAYTITGVVGGMSRVVTYTEEKPLEKPLDDDTEAEPAQAVSQSCLDGKAVVSGAQSCPVMAVLEQTVSTMMA